MLKALVTDDRYRQYKIERDILTPAGIELVVNENGADLAELAADMDALLVNLAKVDAPVIQKLNRCKVISRYGVGYDNVDLIAARAKGISVTNVPDYCKNDSAEHTLALMLTASRRISIHDRHVRAGEWNITAGNPVYRMTGRTYGIIGYGRTGKNVHRLIKGFNFREIFVCSPSTDEQELRKNGARKADLHTLLRESDFISCHVPLNPATERMIGAKEFALMKPNAVFVNTARGKVIDETALIAALTEKRIAMAGLDVFENEPIAKDNPLRTLENVVLTDHQAWYSEESIVELKRRVAENVKAVLTGEGAASIVN
ncbi:MAG: C-terminal binding protein [Spirochaetes bacterium]|nr:C-terminal binding protein [Spirochaetota bacterium]